MKEFHRDPFAASLFVLGALLLCFVSCQSSDNAKTGEGANVASLSLTARIGDTSSRVGMTDIYDGIFSCYWNSDNFNVYHKYRLEGTPQSMMPLAFATTATSGTTATFSCAGGGTYYYNPGARLYAFSSNTSGGYTASVADDGTSTLTAPTLASQNGTLAGCATYDALYGSTNVNYSTGLPESLAMHHLFGMLNLHLTSSTFSTSYPVTVTLTSSAANILPGNSGSATLGADGTTLTPSGSGRWGTSWSATITPTTAGVVDVYLMTWPFSSISGTFSVLCSDATGYDYTSRVITLSGFSLAAAQLKSQPLAIVNALATYSNIYAWDATDYKPVTIGTVPTNANTILSSDYTNSTIHALYACSNCPNYNAISWYLSAQYYWDDGNQSAKGGNSTSYRMANGGTTKAGMWFRKQSKITGFSSTTAFAGTMISSSVALSGLTSTQISALNLSSDYFFLPAAGHTVGAVFSAGGEYGWYWSSTPGGYDFSAVNLHFNSDGADLSGSFYRHDGYCLWVAQ